MLKHIRVMIPIFAAILGMAVFLTGCVDSQPATQTMSYTGADVLTQTQELDDVICNVESRLENQGTKLSEDTVLDYLDSVEKEVQQMESENKIQDYHRNEASLYVELLCGEGYLYVPTLEDYDAGSGADSFYIATCQPCLAGYDASLSRYMKCIDNGAHCVDDAFEEYQFIENGQYDANFDDDEVTEDSFRQFGRYRLILWHGHGAYDSVKGSLMVIGDTATAANNNKYSEALRAHEMVHSSGGGYMVSAAYFTRIIPDDALADTIVYLGTCSSGVDDRLANAFLKKGATAVFANNAVIKTVYNQKMIESVSEGLCQKNGNQLATVSQALAYAQQKNGQSDSNGTQVVLYTNNTSATLKTANQTTTTALQLNIDDYLGKWYDGNNPGYRGEGAGLICVTIQKDSDGYYMNMLSSRLASHDHVPLTITQDGKATFSVSDSLGSVSGTLEFGDDTVKMITKDVNYNNPGLNPWAPSDDDVMLYPRPETPVYSDRELCSLATIDYYYEFGKEPPYVEVDHSNGNMVTLHLFEIVNNQRVTWDWYTVDRTTCKGENSMGESIDILNPNKTNKSTQPSQKELALKAYKSFVSQKHHEDEWIYDITEYALFDLNQDGIPELLTKGGGKMDYSKIFTYRNGNVENIHYGTDFDVYANGVIYYCFSGGDGYILYSYYSMDDSLNMNLLFRYAEWSGFDGTTYSIGEKAYEEDADRVSRDVIEKQVNSVLNGASIESITYYNQDDPHGWNTWS